MKTDEPKPAPEKEVRNQVAKEMKMHCQVCDLQISEDEDMTTHVGNKGQLFYVHRKAECERNVHYIDGKLEIVEAEVPGGGKNAKK